MLKLQTLLALIVATFLCTACSHGAKPASVVGGTESASAGKGAEIATQELSYEAGGVQLKGYLAYPATAVDKRPGVLVAHEWWGLNDYARERARKLAELGYVALAIDMYGEGKHTEHPADAKAWLGALMADQGAAVQRFEAGKAALAADSHVDPKRIAAIGYCFGGALVLHAARRGDELALVASFHGNYATDKPMAKDAFHGKLLIAHGAADSFTPPAQVDALKQELDAAGASYEFVSYEGAKHGFTNPGATALGQQTGLDIAYDPSADAQSWTKLQELLARAFN